MRTECGADLNCTFEECKRRQTYTLERECPYPSNQRITSLLAAFESEKAEAERLRGLLTRIVKYATEDRAVTPGSTRLARAILEVKRLLGIPDGPFVFILEKEQGRNYQF